MLVTRILLLDLLQRLHALDALFTISLFNSDIGAVKHRLEYLDLHIHDETLDSLAAIFPRGIRRPYFQECLFTIKVGIDHADQDQMEEN